MKIAEVMYQRLTDAGLEVILMTEMKERCKIHDADLIGIPIE